MGLIKQWVGDVVLEPINHIYQHKTNGKVYTSVTKVLHSFVPEFDDTAVALRISKQKDSNPRKNPLYYGMTCEQILDLWQQMNDEANEYGNFIHDGMERYFLAHKRYKPQNKFETAAIKSYESLGINEGKVLYPERVMFSEKHSLAGTSDLIIDIDDVWFDVLDYKGLDVNTPILTNNGWRTMGTLTLTDEVFDKDGDLVKIKAISGIKRKKCYRITFDCGETVVSDFEHRWLISYHEGGVDYTDVVLTTEEILGIFTKQKGSKKYPFIKGNSFISSSNKVNQVTKMFIGMDPEYLGSTLGGKNNGKVIPNKIIEAFFNNPKNLDYVMLNTNYYRISLLYGFMLGCGFKYNGRKEVFSVEHKELEIIDFMVTLLSAMGVKVLKSHKKRRGVLYYKITFKINFTFDEFGNLVMCPSTLIGGDKINKIVDIELVETVPTRCIEVDSPTHTFLFGKNFIVTHNTNKEFNFFDSFKKTLHPPLEHLQDCQFHIYTLQLSIYAYMYQLEFPEKKCRQINLLYWNKEGMYFTRVPTVYLKNEAKAILETHRINTLLI